MREEAVRVPQVLDIGAALRVYATRITLTNADICALFGRKICPEVLAKLRRMARRKQDEMGIIPTNPATVSTAAAYAAWGLDIGEMERRWRLLRKLEGTAR